MDRGRFPRWMSLLIRDLDQTGKFSLTLRGSCSRAANDGEPSSAVGHPSASALHRIWSALWGAAAPLAHSTAGDSPSSMARRAGLSRSTRTNPHDTTVHRFRGGSPARHDGVPGGFRCAPNLYGSSAWTQDPISENGEPSRSPRWSYGDRGGACSAR
jgi:hypothetical protein